MAATPVIPTLEVEFVPGSGVYVDISSRVAQVTVNHPRSNPIKGIDAAPTTLTAIIRNYPDATGYCPYTPDSPAAAKYPNITRDRRVRLKVLVSGNTYVRFHGWSDSWIPEAPAGDPSAATVTLTASCVLSRYARIKSLSLYGDVLTKTPGPIFGHDYYPFNEPTESAIVRGITSDGVALYGARVIQSGKVSGTATFAAPSGGHLADGEVEFARGNDEAPAPIIRLQLRPGELMNKFQASIKLSDDPRAGIYGDAIVTAYDITGARLWVFAAQMDTVTKLVTWQLYDNAGTNQTFNSTLSPRDDSWHHFEVSLNASSSGMVIKEKGGVGVVYGSFTWPYDPRPVAWLILGGQMEPRRIGKQFNTFQGSISSFLVQYVGSGGFNYAEFAVPNAITDAARAINFISFANSDLDAIAGAVGTFSPDDTPIAYTNQTTNQLDRWNEHVRTIGGFLATLPTGERYYLRARDARPSTVALTLDAWLDLDMPSGGWQGVTEPTPTRVRAESPVGAVTVIDTATEALTGIPLDGPTLSLAAGSPTVLQSAAGAYMAGDGSRLSQFGLSVEVMNTDKSVALFGLKPGDRVRIDNLNPALTGITYRDVHVNGWQETYLGELRQAQFQFDTDDADDPPIGVFDSTTYGRFGMGVGAATITGGTCVGNTGTGTVIITTSSPLSTSGALYPAFLNWNGEKITISGVGGGTSPQTATVSARGVAPSVARVHATGETVEVHNALRFGF